MSGFLAVVLTAGSAAAENTLQAETAIVGEQPSAKMADHAAKGEVIVVFNKGMTYEEAVKVAEGYGMEVAKYYKTLSEQNDQPYMLLRSSNSTESMLQQLQNDTHVASVSSNQRRSLDKTQSSSQSDVRQESIKSVDAVTPWGVMLLMAGLLFIGLRPLRKGDAV